MKRSPGIACDDCGADTKVASTRKLSGRIVRHRKCENCGATTTTVEQTIGTPVDQSYISVTKAELSVLQFCESLGIFPFPGLAGGCRDYDPAAMENLIEEKRQAHERPDHAGTETDRDYQR